MNITNFGFYTIQCKFRDPAGAPRFPRSPAAGYLHVPWARRDPVGITQWTLLPPPMFEDHHFHWLFIQAGEPNHYYIVNRRSGLCLAIPTPPDPQNPQPQQLSQNQYSPERDDEFRFVLEADPSTESSWTLTCYLSGYPILVDNAIPNDGQRLMAWPDVSLGDRRNWGHAAFELTKVDVAAQTPKEYSEEGSGPEAVRQPPQLTALDTYLPTSFPDRRDAVILEHDVIPFFAVNDPGLAPYRQIDLSPYYTLKHWQRWDKVLDRQFDGRTNRKTTESIVVGITQRDASSFRKTFRWSVEYSVEYSAEAGVKTGGISASAKSSATLTAKVEGEVERTSQRSTERKVDRTWSEEVDYPALGIPYRIVTWVPVDIYELCRTDTNWPISTWTVTREGENVTVNFPQMQVQAPRRLSAFADDGGAPVQAKE